MRQNNKGFTLIELIVATAILGIVLLGACGFMVSGAGAFRTVYDTIRLEHTAQQTENQMQSVIMACDTALFNDGDTLYLADKEKDDSYTVYAYILEDETLSLQKVRAVNRFTNPDAIVSAKRHTLATGVKSFAASIERDAGTGRTVSVVCTLTFVQQDKEYTGTQTVALRNRPNTVAGLDALILACT